MPPYCALLNAVPVGWTRVTHHWLWWLKTLGTEVSRPFLTEFFMDHHETWYVGWYCPPTVHYWMPLRSDAHESRTIDFGGYKRLKQRFLHHFWQSSWWMITKLDMWVGITTILTPINWRSGRMHRLHAPLTLMAKNARNRGFRSVSHRDIYGWSPNLACGLVLPPYWTLLTAVPVGCAGVTHHWLWGLKRFP